MGSSQGQCSGSNVNVYTCLSVSCRFKVLVEVIIQPFVLLKTTKLIEVLSGYLLSARYNANRNSVSKCHRKGLSTHVLRIPCLCNMFVLLGLGAVASMCCTKFSPGCASKGCSKMLINNTWLQYCEKLSGRRYWKESSRP